MNEINLFHQVNIIFHVAAGTTALFLGISILILKKGTPRHKKLGRIFLGLMAIVICTGLLGVLAFGRNNFLLVLTLLSGYNAFSGYRIIKSRSNKPKILDIIIALVTLTSGLYFLYYIKSFGMIWDPVVIYSTLGALFLTIAYDLFRYLIPKATYGKLWLYEHIYKLTSSLTALFSAFVGTVLPNFQPFSQILPSAIGTVIAIGFIIYFYRRSTFPT